MAEDHQIEVTELENEINNRKTEESKYEEYASAKREFEDLLKAADQEEEDADQEEDTPD